MLSSMEHDWFFWSNLMPQRDSLIKISYFIIFVITGRWSTVQFKADGMRSHSSQLAHILTPWLPAGVKGCGNIRLVLSNLMFLKYRLLGPGLTTGVIWHVRHQAEASNQGSPCARPNSFGVITTWFAQ